MILRNSTALDSQRLSDMFRPHIDGWPHETLRVHIRYGRSAPFSGACYYKDARIHVNIGRRVRYPYRLVTHAARPTNAGSRWWREPLFLEVPDAYRLVLFVFLHEFYHWLVACARRSPRQKEGRCDRFAVRALVDEHGLKLRTAGGEPPARHIWDFQDLVGFVSAARRSASDATRRASSL